MDISAETEVHTVESLGNFRFFSFAFHKLKHKLMKMKKDGQFGRETKR